MVYPVGIALGIEQGVSASCTGAYSLLDPITNIFYYLVPKIATWSPASQKVRKKGGDDPATGELKDRVRYRTEIEMMSKAAGVTGKVTPYLGSAFASHGGKYSLTNPVIQIPHWHLNRHGGYANFGADGKQPPEEILDRYDDQGTRFLILRSLVQIRMNDSFFKTIARIAVVAALVLLKINPLTWPISLTILLLAIALYFVVDRYTQGRLDKEAAKSLIELTLTKTYKDELEKLRQSNKDALDAPINVRELKEQTIDAAILVLNKQKQQNLNQRASGRRRDKILIDSEGNERFNMGAPSFARRLQKLEGLKAKIQREEPSTIKSIAELETALALLENDDLGAAAKPKVDEEIGFRSYPLF